MCFFLELWYCGLSFAAYALINACVFKISHLKTMRTCLLTFLLIAPSLLDQIHSIQLIANDLVYVHTLNHQKGPENAQNARVFNESFGWVCGWRWCKNRNSSCKEYIIQSVKHPSKHLAIRRKYLKLIPQIQIHDTSKLNATQTKILWLNLISHQHEFTYFPEWHYDALKNRYRGKNFTDRIIKPIALERYPTMRIISKIRCKWWRVFEDMVGKNSLIIDLCRIDWLLAFMHFSHKFVVKEILLASKRSLDSPCSNKIFAKLSKMHTEMCTRPLNLLDVRKSEMFGFVKNFFRDGYFDGYPILLDSCNATKCKVDKCKLLKILECPSKDMILRQIWKQIKIWKQNYEVQMTETYSTNDWEQLLCIDVAVKYHSTVMDKGRILHVILPRDMNPNSVKNRLGTFWDSQAKRGVLRMTPSNLIVEPYSRIRYYIRVMPGWLLWFVKVIYLTIFYQSMSIGIISRPWNERIIWLLGGGLTHYMHFYTKSSDFVFIAATGLVCALVGSVSNESN